MGSSGVTRLDYIVLILVYAQEEVRSDEAPHFELPPRVPRAKFKLGYLISTTKYVLHTLFSMSLGPRKPPT